MSLLIPNTTTSRMQIEKPVTTSALMTGIWFTVEMAEEIRRFEQEHDATVFLAVRMITMFGDLDALLFVGKYDEEWGLEHDDLKAGYAMSYCLNRDYPDCSEMGSIAFRITKDGAIVREG